MDKTKNSQKLLKHNMKDLPINERLMPITDCDAKCRYSSGWGSGYDDHMDSFFSCFHPKHCPDGIIMKKNGKWIIKFKKGFPVCCPLEVSNEKVKDS